MASGFPISACIGRDEVMDGWPPSSGEAIHTSTFLGNPTGCAAALASIRELRERRLVERSASLGTFIGEALSDIQRMASDVLTVRGLGMMWGVQCANSETAAGAVHQLLRSGVIALVSGVRGDVISLSPPLVISEEQLRFSLDALRKCFI
jgi:4-aminobutyrate aminotransferase-like enzyme